MPNATPQSPAKRISAFFYGSFMRREVMARVGFQPAQIEVARLNGFDISFCPHANISRSDQHSIYGILVQITHQELDRLYSMDGVGVFLPEAVLVETRLGTLQPAVCYIPPSRDDKPADSEYVNHLIMAAREYAFPEWYVARLKSFC